MSYEPILEALAALDTKLTSQIQGLDDRLTGLDDRLTGQINTLRVDLMARLDRHANALSAIRDDLVVNMHSANRASDVNLATRAEVGEMSKQINAMWRQINTLQTQVRALTGDL